MSEDNDKRINIEDLPQAEQELTPEEAKDVKGGILIGMLLPAVQKVRATETPQADSLIKGGEVIGKGIAGDGS